MRKLIIASGLLALTSGITQAQAAPSISEFLDSGSAQGYYNCSYKGKTASKKCLVIKSEVKASIDPRTKEFYGSNYSLPLLTIKWPDGDTSRYITMDSWEIINLADKKSYRARNWDNEIGFSKGLYIDESGKDHVRLW